MMSNPHTAAAPLTASGWHMKFLRSWQFILLAVCVALTFQAELLSIRLSGTLMDMGELMKGVVQQAEAAADEAQREAVQAKGGPTDYAQATFQNYQTLSQSARRLSGSRIAFIVIGWALRISAICSLLLIPFLLLTPISEQVARITTQGLFVLTKGKLYAFVVLIAGFLMALPGIGDVMEMVGSTSPVMYLLLLCVPVVVVFYVLMLRNVSVIAADIARAMRQNRYPHAFGHSCGLSWQPLIPAGACIVALLAALLGWDSWHALLSGLYQALTLTAGTLSVSRFGVVLWLIFTCVKFTAIALAYPKFVQFSTEMKGAAVDVLVSNTAGHASPIYYTRK